MSSNKILSSKSAIAIEAFYRLLVWGLFLAVGESFCEAYVGRYAAGSCWYYILLFLFSVLLFVTLKRFRNNDLTRDMRELYFYDGLVQLVGLGLYFARQTAFIWIVLNLAILLVKTLRLLWPGKKPDGTAFAGWPVFGVLGIIAALRGKTDLRTVPASMRHDLSVYAGCAATLPAAYLLASYGPDDAALRLIYLPFSFVLLYGKLLVDHVIRFFRKYAELKRMVAANRQAPHPPQLEARILHKENELASLLTPEIIGILHLVTRLNPDMRAMFKRLMEQAHADQKEDEQNASAPKRQRPNLTIVPNQVRGESPDSHQGK
jgi:Ca2+/Na+ antiporter